jgi:transposase
MDSSAVLLPHLASLRLDRLFLKGTGVRIEASTIGPHAECSSCGSESGRVHSRYQRPLTDTGLGGREVLLVLTVRRFFCDHSGCAKRTFAEQVPGLTRRYGRHTGPAEHVVASVAMALGGRAGARLVGGLAVPVGRV